MGELLSPLFRCVNWGTESVSSVLWITQLASGRNGIQNQIVWLEGLYFSPSLFFFFNWLQGLMSVVLILTASWNHLRNFKKCHFHTPPSPPCISVSQSCPTLCEPVDCSQPVPLSMEFSRQEYWSSLLFPSPGDLPDPRIEHGSPVLQAYSLPSEPPGKPPPS